MAFFFIGDDSSSTNSATVKKDEFARTFNKDSGATCGSCKYWGVHKCGYYKEYISSTDMSCDGHKYR